MSLEEEYHKARAAQGEAARRAAGRATAQEALQRQYAQVVGDLVRRIEGELIAPFLRAANTPHARSFARSDVKTEGVEARSLLRSRRERRVVEDRGYVWDIGAEYKSATSPDGRPGNPYTSGPRLLIWSVGHWLLAATEAKTDNDWGIGGSPYSLRTRCGIGRDEGGLGGYRSYDSQPFGVAAFTERSASELAEAVRVLSRRQRKYGSLTGAEKVDLLRIDADDVFALAATVLADYMARKAIEPR